MNKYKTLFGICLMILLLSTGCTKKTIVSCKIDSDTLDINYDIIYNDDKLNSLEMSLKMDASKLSDSELDDLKDDAVCKEMKDESEFGKKAVVSCKQKIDKENVTVNATIDADKIDSDNKNDYKKPEDAKKYFENEGFECKIKK